MRILKENVETHPYKRYFVEIKVTGDDGRYDTDTRVDIFDLPENVLEKIAEEIKNYPSHSFDVWDEEYEELTESVEDKTLYAYVYHSEMTDINIVVCSFDKEKLKKYKSLAETTFGYAYTDKEEEYTDSKEFYNEYVRPTLDELKDNGVYVAMDENYYSGEPHYDIEEDKIYINEKPYDYVALDRYSSRF